jgi:hypothetical protein
VAAPDRGPCIRILAGQGEKNGEVGGEGRDAWLLVAAGRCAWPCW